MTNQAFDLIIRSGTVYDGSGDLACAWGAHAAGGDEAGGAAAEYDVSARV